MEMIKNLFKFKSDPKLSWFNFDTKKYDYIDTPEDYAPYIPEGPARNLFYLYVDHMDWNPSDAMIEVLKKCIGDE